MPPQVPVNNSVSSVSPQRRPQGDIASPLPLTNQRTFAYSHPLPSPHSYGRSEQSTLNGYGSISDKHGMAYNGQITKSRPVASYPPPRRSNGAILPTPEPTVGSVISDEDVALQLMRLGDASNFSHGRTSTSTLDDALSGKADAASSDEETEDEEEELALPGPRYPVKDPHHAGPKRKKLRRDDSNAIESESDEYAEVSDHHDHEHDGINGQGNHGKSNGSHKRRNSTSSASVNGPKKAADGIGRKTSQSIPAVSLGPDEEDLSAKPRCQRCRKSKKGCDRQRPCGRCKDAGIGIEGCISEDEGNGRRGRYGRHMGVVIKKDGKDTTMPMVPSPLGAPSRDAMFIMPALPSDGMKKRKRST